MCTSTHNLRKHCWCKSFFWRLHAFAILCSFYFWMFGHIYNNRRRLWGALPKRAIWHLKIMSTKFIFKMENMWKFSRFCCYTLWVKGVASALRTLRKKKTFFKHMKWKLSRKYFSKWLHWLAGSHLTRVEFDDRDKKLFAEQTQKKAAERVEWIRNLHSRALKPIMIFDVALFKWIFRACG